MNIKTKDLRPALEVCQRFNKGRTTLPVLSCVRIEAKDNVLSISATDIVRYVILRVPCEGDLPACCVPSAMLRAVMAQCGDEATLTLNDDLTRLAVKGDIRATLPVLPQAEFPAEPKKGTAIGCNTADVASVIQRGSWATAPEDNVAQTATQICRIYISARAIGCESSNGYQVARCELGGIGAEAEFCVLPRDAEELATILESTGASINLSESFVCAESEKACVWINRPAVKFPDLSPVFGSPSTPIARIEKEHIENICGVLVLTSSLTNPKESPNVRLVVAKGADSEGTIRIESISPTTECAREFEAGVEGNYSKMFGAEKLLAALREVESFPAKLSFIGSGALRIESGDCVSLVAGLIDMPKAEA